MEFCKTSLRLEWNGEYEAFSTVRTTCKHSVNAAAVSVVMITITLWKHGFSEVRSRADILEWYSWGVDSQPGETALALRTSGSQPCGHFYYLLLSVSFSRKRYWIIPPCPLKAYDKAMKGRKGARKVVSQEGSLLPCLRRCKFGYSCWPS